MSILYSTITLFGPADIYRFIVNREQFLLSELNLYSQSQCCFLCTILGCFLLHLIHSSVSPASVYCSEVANFVVACVSFSTCWALSQGMAAVKAFTCLFCRHFCLHIFPWAFLVYCFTTLS